MVLQRAIQLTIRLSRYPNRIGSNPHDPGGVAMRRPPVRG